MFPVSDGRKMLSPVRVMFLFGSRQHACIVKSVAEKGSQSAFSKTIRSEGEILRSEGQ